MNIILGLLFDAKKAISWNSKELPLRIDEGDHNVANALGDLQTLVVVCQSAGVHERPAHSWTGHRAVVAHETASSSLDFVKRNEEGENGID